MPYRFENFKRYYMGQRRKIRKYLEMNDKGNIVYQNLGKVVKTVYNGNVLH